MMTNIECLCVFSLQLIINTMASFNLTILHTNDVGARLDSFNNKAHDCTQQEINDNLCFGGAARRMTAIHRFRQENEHLLLLDAGDQFQGSLYYTFLKWRPIVEIMNKLAYDAMSFGNHEFDDRADGLIPFLEEANFPIIASNLECSDLLFGDLYKKSAKIRVGWETIGLVGYITTTTPSASKPPDYLRFKSEVPALQEAVDELEAEGINKIIAIGHSGFKIDKQICREVEGIDVVIGGHTNTFLYNGPAPSIEDPVDSYPVEVTQRNGKKCLVIQDYAFAKYLGFLQVQFDTDGEMTSWNGNPILLDNRFPPDRETEQIIDHYRPLIEARKTRPIGKTASALDGDRKICRARECNFGNLITDAAIFAFQKKPENSETESWTKASIAIVNGGTLRNSVKIDVWSNLTQGNLYTAMPFSDTYFSRYLLKGSHVLELFEHSASHLNDPDAAGGFLQVSGVKVVYNKTKPVGQRVVSLKLRCAKCPIPLYEPLDLEEEYWIIIDSFIANGGDSFDMIRDNAKREEGYALEFMLIDVVSAYIQQFQPIRAEIEGRITVLPCDDGICENYCLNGAISATIGSELSVIVYLISIFYTIANF